MLGSLCKCGAFRQTVGKAEIKNDALLWSYGAAKLKSSAGTSPPSGRAILPLCGTIHSLTVVPPNRARFGITGNISWSTNLGFGLMCRTHDPLNNISHGKVADGRPSELSRTFFQDVIALPTQARSFAPTAHGACENATVVNTYSMLTTMAREIRPFIKYRPSLTATGPFSIVLP